MRDHARRQRVVAHGAAAELRHQRADIGDRVALDPQHDKLVALRIDRLERNARQPQETRRVLGRGEAFDKGHLHQIEIRLVLVVVVLAIVRQMRRLPLHGAACRLHVIVPGAGRAVAMVMMIVIVSLVHRHAP